MLDKPDLAKFDQRCRLVHSLTNKLAVIVGHCDLLSEEVPQDETCLSRVQIISSVAKRMAEDLNEHQCEAVVSARDLVGRNKPPVSISDGLVSAGKRA